MEIWDMPLNFSNDFNKTLEDENRRVNPVKEDIYDSEECPAEKKQDIEEEGDLYDIDVTVKQHDVSQNGNPPDGVQFNTLKNCTTATSQCCHWTAALTMCSGRCC